LTTEFEISKIDKAALELTLQNGCEPAVSPLEGDILDIKLDYIKPVFPIDEDKLANKLRTAFRKNMEQHEGKKIGVQLSGGNDSSLCLYLLTKLFPDMDITAYHAYFGDPTRDERKYANIAAKAFHTDLKVVDLDVHRQIELIPECTEHCNVVMSALVYSYGLIKKMAEDGMDVVVYSIGPDEYFGAYAFDKRYYERKPFFGMVPTHNKYFRELSKRYGTDKAFFVNNFAIASGEKHVKNNKYSVDNWYDDFFVENLWITLKRWMWERDLGGQYRIVQQPAKHFGMESAFPYLEKDLAEYCFGCTPISVYNKAPMRSLMRYWGVPEENTRRGENWNIGSDDKVGYQPSNNFYTSFTRKFFPKIGGDKLVDEYFTPYVKKNLLKWMTLGDRRAQQIGLLLRMLERM